jgi:hypothetical protein
MALRDQIAPEMLNRIPSDRLKNIDIIEWEFYKAGLPIEFAAAAVVNAWHESKLKSGSEGDWSNKARYVAKYSPAELEEICTYSDRPHPCPQSIGLFQLKSPTGAGGKMSAAQRKDPASNTRKIIEQVQKKYGDAMRAAYANGERKVSHFTGLFCRDIERPGNKQGCWDNRAKEALDFFPKDRVSSRPIWPWIVGIAGVLGLGYGIWYWRFKR